jgi:hypothetical protein
MIASMINIIDLNFDSPLKYASSFLSIVVLAALALATCIEIYLIRAHIGKYQVEEFIFRYGALVEGLDINKIIGRYWNPINLIRWALTILIMIFLNKHYVAQIFLLLAVSVIFQIMMVISNPMTNKWNKRINFMIEVIISIYLYVLLSLTDFIGENTLREELGWILTILTGSITAINISILFWKSFWMAVIYIKQRFGHIII